MLCCIRRACCVATSVVSLQEADFTNVMRPFLPPHLVSSNTSQPYPCTHLQPCAQTPPTTTHNQVSYFSLCAIYVLIHPSTPSPSIHNSHPPTPSHASIHTAERPSPRATANLPKDPPTGPLPSMHSENRRSHPGRYRHEAATSKTRRQLAACYLERTNHLGHAFVRLRVDGGCVKSFSQRRARSKMK